MKTKLLLAAGAISLLSIGGGASQAAIVGGIDVNGPSATGNVPEPLHIGDVFSITGAVSGNAVSFDHLVGFKLAEDGAAAVAGAKVLLTHNGSTLVDISNFAYQIIDEDGSTVLAAGLSPASIFADDLDQGDPYFVRLTGLTGGILGGNYKVDIAITPVPAGFLLLGSAVLGLGFVGYHRRKTQP